MLEVRREAWWARCWRDEEMPHPAPGEVEASRVLDVPSYSDLRSTASTFAVERWHHRGGKVAYAMLGFEFRPSAMGQLVVQVSTTESTEQSELVADALRSVKWLLVHELGPGWLTLTHFGFDGANTSVASVATASCAAAFVATHRLDEVERESERLLLRPCQFESVAHQASRLPESIAQRAGVNGVVLGGPWTKGEVRIGDELAIHQADSVVAAKVLSFPSIRYGSEEPIWHSIEVDLHDPELVDVPAVVTGYPHWRPPPCPKFDDSRRDVTLVT